jgi:hypothetical protein
MSCKYFCVLLALLSVTSCTFFSGTTAPSSGYDVVLLVGQSNMVGVGRGPDNSDDAASNPRVWQLDPANRSIIEAHDPLIQNQTVPNAVGLGMTFAKSYLKSIPSNRNVLLVGAAANNTTFVSGRWKAPNGDLAVAAVQRANEAMSKAGPCARFAGILWLQGEGDIEGGGAESYQGNLLSLISYFRTQIHGAGSRTPFVVGEMNQEWLKANATDPKLGAAQNTVLAVFHTLPSKVPYTAWVSSADLGSDAINGIIHFSALSQRQLGRRYATKFFQARRNSLTGAAGNQLARNRSF